MALGLRLPERRKSVSDPWMDHAIGIIMSDDGVHVDTKFKQKDLLKFGRNKDVETEIATLMTLPDGVDNETYVETDLITTIISSNAGDGETVSVEGHTISGGDKTFLVQPATLNGQTAVTLTTPLSRCSRVKNSSATELQGLISVTEDDTFTAGVPDTDAGVHLQVVAGMQQSEKASTSLSSVDYWVVTSFHGEMFSKLAAFAEVELEIRLAGEVFLPVDDISCSDAHDGILEFKPYCIVKPNSDVRLRSISDAAGGRDVGGSIQGTLLKARA